MLFLKTRKVGTSVFTFLCQSKGVGRVHSIFRGLINLDFYTNELVTITDGTSMMVPSIITVYWHASCDTLSIHAPCEYIKNKDGTLCIIIDSKIMINTSGAQHWNACITALPSLEGDSSTIQRAFIQYWRECLSTYWLSDTAHTQFYYLLASKIIQGIQYLIQGERTKNIQYIKTGFDNLCGVGWGLTPSGDDILVGWLLGLYIRNHQRMYTHFYQNCIALFKNARQTTDISLTYFQQAARGEFAEVLLALVHEIRKKRTIDSKILHTVGSHGHYSGNDLLVGIYTGLFQENLLHTYDLESKELIC